MVVLAVFVASMSLCPERGAAGSSPCLISLARKVAHCIHSYASRQMRFSASMHLSVAHARRPRPCWHRPCVGVSRARECLAGRLQRSIIMRKQLATAVLALSFVGIPALVGCDRTISDEKTVKTDPDTGKTTVKEKKVEQTPDGG